MTINLPEFQPTLQEFQLILSFLAGAVVSLILSRRLFISAKPFAEERRKYKKWTEEWRRCDDQAGPRRAGAIALLVAGTACLVVCLCFLASAFWNKPPTEAEVRTTFIEVPAEEASKEPSKYFLK